MLLLEGSQEKLRSKITCLSIPKNAVLVKILSNAKVNAQLPWLHKQQKECMNINIWNMNCYQYPWTATVYNITYHQKLQTEEQKRRGTWWKTSQNSVKSTWKVGQSSLTFLHPQYFFCSLNYIPNSKFWLTHLHMLCTSKADLLISIP